MDGRAAGWGISRMSRSATNRSSPLRRPEPALPALTSPTSLPVAALFPRRHRQWIGAIELGFVLDTLLGVGHRVLTAPSGDEVPGLARQIAHHFDTQGGCGCVCVGAWVGASRVMSGNW